MDLEPILPSKAYIHNDIQKKRKETHDNLVSSRRLVNYLILSVIINTILSCGLIFYPPAPSRSRCAKFCNEICPQSHSTVPSNIARAIDLVVAERVETNALAVRSTGALAERDRLEDINGRINVGAIYVWPFVQAVAWWNMVAACQDFNDNASNSINCVWGVITSVVTLAAGGIKTVVWARTITNAYILGTETKRDLSSHPQLGSMLDELGSLTGQNATYHGLWDHAKLGLNYSEQTMENEDPLHIFGLTAPDGSQSHFAYLGNSTGKHAFKLGMGAPLPVSSNATNSSSEKYRRGQVTMGNQYFRFGGVDVLVDPNPYDNGYLNYVSADWNAVLAQVSCLWGADPESDMLKSQSTYFQIYDDINEETVAAGAMSMFLGPGSSAIGSLNTFPLPILLGSCRADFKDGP